MGIRLYRPTAQYEFDLELGIGKDANSGLVTLAADGKVRVIGLDGNGANAAQG